MKRQNTFHWVTEEAPDPKGSLLILKTGSSFGQKLANYLRAQGMDVTVRQDIPTEMNEYSNVFLISNNYQDVLSTIQTKKNSLSIITANESVYKKTSRLLDENESLSCKIAFLENLTVHEKSFDRLLGFFFSETSSRMSFLQDLHSPAPIEKQAKQKKPVSKKRLVLFLVVSCILFEFFFLLPLAISGLYLYKSYNYLKESKTTEARATLEAGKPYLSITEITYAAARPVLSFFFVGFFFDNVVESDKTAYELIDLSSHTLDNGKIILSNFISKDSSIPTSEARYRIKTLSAQIDQLHNLSQKLSNKLTYDIYPVNEIRSSLQQADDFIQEGTGFIKHLDELLAGTKQKKYILYFYNNMELRPGGGFIGSLAFVTVKDYHLEAFEIHDVYDIDGQLLSHVDPPPAITSYLGQPHWYLRDSNFSPDFEKNVENGAFFLNKSLNMPDDADGELGITATALSYIIEAFGTIELPDYNESITKDNFYLKTQLAVEDEFFPGSTKKKTYLSSITDALLRHVTDANLPHLGKSIERALKEKHIVMHMRDTQFQADIEKTGWHGKVLLPSCLRGSDCIRDYVMAVDANLGANKANYYVSRFMEIQPSFTKNGTIENTVNITYKNDSPTSLFPGGPYKNYLRLYIPKEAEVKEVSVNNTPLPTFIEQDAQTYKYVELYFIIDPKDATQVSMLYTLDRAIPSNQLVNYQLVVQKQIGSINNDLQLSLQHDPAIEVATQNFQAIAKTSSLNYNTTLTNDRIFVIQLQRK